MTNFEHAMMWYGFATADAAEYDRKGCPNAAAGYRYRAKLHLMNAIGFASL